MVSEFLFPWTACPAWHVGRSEFIDNSKVAGLAPEISEPPANNSLIILLLRHDHFSCCVRSMAVRDQRTAFKVDFDGGRHTPLVVRKSKLTDGRPGTSWSKPI